MAAYITSGLVQDRIGIKRSYLIYFTMAVIGSSLYILVGRLHEMLVPILLLFTAYGISSACMTNWLSNAKLFPVIFTSSTFGISSFFARFANIMSPQVAEIE